MSNINELIKKFEYIANNPKKMLEDVKNSSKFKGAVGIMPLYAPEEIVYSLGYLPMGIWGSNVEIQRAGTYLPPFACSIMQSVMEMELLGTFDDLDAVIFSVPCDTLKCMSQKYKGKSPAIVFTHPQNRNLDAANEFLKAEYKILIKKLENLLNVKYDENSLIETIKIYNENRKTLREFTELVSKYSKTLDAIVRHNVIKSRYFMDKKEHTELVKELISLLKEMPEEEITGRKVVLTGIMAEPTEFLQVLKDENFIVVADDLAQESRQFREDVVLEKDPLISLSKWWQSLTCSIATDVDKRRGKLLIDLYNKNNADAIIICMMKFCDPEEFDYPIYIQELKEENIKNIMVDIDLNTQSFEQIKTRLQSFNEILTV